MSVAGIDLNSRRGILEMTEAALDLVDSNPARLASIMPYYPNPAELGYALERAERTGVRGADALLQRVRASRCYTGRAAADAPVCCSLGARVVWTCPTLHAVRAWVHQM
jgi:hypothetical protein